jgi:hypothetical protein
MTMHSAIKVYGNARRIWIVLFLLAATAVLFVALCLILEEGQSRAVQRPNELTLPTDVFVSQPALIVYCTILAGVLGTAVRILTKRLSTDAGLSGVEAVGTVAAQVFLGGAFAFAAGFLVPHALAAKTISDSYNVWSLMIIGGFAGYASTGVAGSVQEGLQGLIAGLRQGVADVIIKEEVSKTIAESAKEAMALPEPVAYAGVVEVDVTDERDMSIVQSYPPTVAPPVGAPTDLEGPKVLLKADTAYSVRIRLVPHIASQGPRPTRPIAFPIDIEGRRAQVVPLDVRLDYGFQELPIARYRTEARANSETELPAFAFRTPSILPLPPSTIQPDSEPTIPPRLTIAILQNKVPYVRRQIPLALAGLSPSASYPVPAAS